MAAPSKVIQLVKKFEEGYSNYKSHHYNEENLKIEFLNPLFEALGWDLRNEAGFSNQYKDVEFEHSLKIGRTTKSPDYAFKIGGTNKFFVEAKKPSENIESNPKYAFQLRHYAWNAKLPLSILTDFEEFAVYNTRLKPNLNDKSNIGRVLYFKYTDYINKWDEIASIFSKEAVWKGGFDKYSENDKLKKGTTEVDDEFLKEIENWRETLAKNIAIRNPGLSNRSLNEAVQNTIDRIIFLRICEDKAIEPERQLQILLNGNNVYPRMIQIFRDADEKYNSGLFHFQKEADRDNYDSISLELNIDDKPLKDIIKRLYYPESPYEFSVIPIEILGQVYERFLGKVIRLTAGHQAKIEEKPEVRKAGGVYYTPQYIVNYIVENTVGKILENKTIDEAKQIRILDPACGSGSFLIGAYRYLLEWYTKKYCENPDKYIKQKNPPIRHACGSDYCLTTKEKKEILLSNIYGVDIDAQAVEVTKLSLLLKVLESETEETISSQFRLFKERALPDLCNNIKCGNSLIRSDFYENKNLSIFKEDDYQKINAFDWEKEFPEVFKYSQENIRTTITNKIDKHVHAAVENIDRAIYHTDKVIEYVDELSNMVVKEPVSEYKPERFMKQGFDIVIGNPPWGADVVIDKGYFNIKYINKSTDSSAYFLELSVNLSKTLVGFIVPKTIAYYAGWESIRNLIINNSNIENVVDTGIAFPDVNLESIILILNKSKNIEPSSIYHALPIKKAIIPKTIEYQGEFNNEIIKIANIIPFISLSKYETELLKKLYENTLKIKDIALHIFRGLYIPDSEKEKLKKGPYKFVNKVPDVKRYYIEKIWEIDIDGKHEWIKKSENILRPRVFIKVLRGNRLISYPDINGEYLTTEKLVNLVINKKKYPVSELFISGLINSKISSYYIEKVIFSDTTETSRVMDGIYLNHLIIPNIDFNNKRQKAQHDRMVSLVENILELKKRENEAILSSNEKEMLKRQIEMTDEQIDRLVYDFYGLTEEEISIVEGSYSNKSK